MVEHYDSHARSYACKFIIQLVACRIDRWYKLDQEVLRLTFQDVFDKQYFVNVNNSRGNQGNAQAIQNNLPRDVRRYGGLRATFNF